MKTIQNIFTATMLILVFATSCQRDALDDTAVQRTEPENILSVDGNGNGNGNADQPGTCNPNAYIITLESRTLVNGNWEWIWSAYNPNPGNGNNGTAQDLSHWGMQLGSCVTPASVVSASYSNNGTGWTDFAYSYQTDPSQGCMTTSVLKFDFGTSGEEKSYYRLVLNQDYSMGLVPGYYRSGNRTGCCTFMVPGINGCGGPVEVEVTE